MTSVQATSTRVRADKPEDKPQESKHDKFKRLAAARVNVALKRIEMLEALGSSSYEYTASEAQKVIDALDAAVDKVKSALDREKKSSEPRFHF